MGTLDLTAALQLPDLPKYLQRVEKNLALAMHSDTQILNEPLIRLMSVRGKRIRPSLVLAAATSTGRIDQATIAAATAIELLHIASLVHDDIIDKSALRWNQPTISQKEGVEVAIMTGDFLLARAFEQAATVSQSASKYLSESFTALCNGQALEMQTEHNVNRTINEYFQAIKGKTAVLFSASCLLGATSTGAKQPELKALGEFSQHFGISFQILDDLIDLLSDPSRAGKSTGNDLPSGIYTLPVLLALQSPGGKKLRSYIRKKDFEAASELVYASGACETALNEAIEHLKKAKKALRMAQYPKFERFANFTDDFFAWTMLTHLKDTKLVD